MNHPHPGTGDRRVARSVQSIRQALFALIQEKHYDEITVQNIIDRADVGRSTFYKYFRDKEDLLIGDWKNLLGGIAAHVNLDDPDRLVPIEPFMLHLKEVHRFYRGLVRSGKTDRLFAIGVEFLALKVEERIAARPTIKNDELAIPPALAAHYIALNLFGFLKWWLDGNMPYTPAEMDRMFHQLISPGVREMLATPTKSPRSRADAFQRKQTRPL